MLSSNKSICAHVSHKSELRNSLSDLLLSLLVVGQAAQSTIGKLEMGDARARLKAAL